MSALVPDRRPPHTDVVAVAATPTLVVPKNRRRTKLHLTNVGTEPAFLSFRPDVSDNTGFGLPTGVVFTTDYDGPIYGTCATGAAKVTYWDES